MGQLHWEARAYDDEGNLIVVVHNPEVAELAAQKKKQKPMVEFKTLDSVFNDAVESGLVDGSVKIIWGVVPGDLRLRRPLTEEEKDVQRAEFRAMLVEANERLHMRGPAVSAPKPKAPKPIKEPKAKAPVVPRVSAPKVVVVEGEW